MRLPPAFDSLALGEWATITVEQARSSGLELPPAAMLVYSRRGVHRYDEIAERVAAVAPADVAGGLVGRRTMRAGDERARRSRRPAELEEVRIEQNLLGHRPIDLTIIDGKLRFAVSGDDIVFTDPDSSVELRFALSYPPTMLCEPSVISDQAEPLAWQVQGEMTGLWWMPFPLLVEQGRFERWQEARPNLVRQIGVGQLSLFVSHRWLGTGEPDPDGRHARLLAWQLVATLCESVIVAASRGLHEPARASPTLGTRIGIGGSALAEAMVVGILRRALDDEQLELVRQEAVTLESFLGRNVVAVAEEDVGLPRLRAALADRPFLQRLTENVELWVDYSCLPQAPRSPDEHDEFVAGLRLLDAAQLLGRTVIVLDDVEDYSCRAWCLLEMLTANRLAGTYDVLSGRLEAADPEGGPYQHLSNLLLDLPYIVWRALLDAELFGEIGWEECLERLELAVTDPSDLRYIYDRLLSIPGPNGLHTSEGDLVTGVLPIPLLADGSVLVPTALGGDVALPDPRVLGSLSWSAALSLSADSEARPFAPPTERSRMPFVRRSDREPASKPAHGHLAIVASCEAEAMLLAEWTERRTAALEELAGLTLDSRSWLAVDLAPVGTLVNGLLTSAAIDAPNWLILTTSTRRDHCPVTAAVSTLAIQAGVALAWVLVDVVQGDNVIAMGDVFPVLSRSERPQPDSTRVVATSAVHPVHLGGLYRRDLVARLMEWDHA